MFRRSPWTLCALLVLIAALVAPGSALAAPRPVPEQMGKTGLQDTTPGLQGDLAALNQALAEASNITYKILVIDDTDGEEHEAYLDRALAQWGWPEHDTLLLVVYTGANHDIRFAMGADFRQKWNLSVDEMLDYVRTVYFPEVRDGDPASALAELIGVINRRARPKAPAFAALSLNTDKPEQPDEVVRAFYKWYIEYLGFTGAPPKGNVQADNAYRTSPYLTPEFIFIVDQSLLDMAITRGSYDYFLCGPNRPDDIELVETQEAGDRATTIIQAFKGVNRPQKIQLDLLRVDGRWLIDGRRCPRS